MIKKITKVGNSHALILDSALLQLARLKPGDEVNVEVHAGGTLTISPTERPVIDAEEAAGVARRLIGKNGELFRRLAQ
jgi:antitoxin component of MazEF toxin-antitoxin module